MTPVEFLRAVWPRTGIYCLATKRAGSHSWRHWTFDTIDEAADYIGETSPETSRIDPKKIDIYFAVHSLQKKQVPHNDPAKAAKGETQVRVGRNTQAARSFFWDLDVNPDDDTKFKDKTEALNAFKQFVNETQLPRPMIVSSGYGWHIYWRLTDDIPSQEWRDHAVHLRQLATHYGLKIDTSRTSDTASLLRVGGTFNLKRDEIQPVEVSFPAKEIANGVFLKALSDAMTRAAVLPQQAPRLQQAEDAMLAAMGGSNTKPEYTGPKPRMAAVLETCPQLARLAFARGKYTENEWYFSVIGVGRFTEEGKEGVHRLSVGHPGYNRAACDTKIKQSETQQPGPSSCATIAARSNVGDSLCTGCPVAGKYWGPIQGALKIDEIPPPQVIELIDGEQVTLTIPPPPKPYARTKEGIAVTLKTADGTDDTIVIYDYDLYPIRRLANLQAGTEQHRWHVELPNGESKDFTLDADMLYDIRKFMIAIAHQGIYPTRGAINQLQEYMTAYIRELQRLAGADAQCNHLGWLDEDRTQFILPDKIMVSDGTHRPAQLSTGAQRASLHVRKAGTLEKQVELLKFYNHPEYLAHQFLVLASLAAPMFYATGYHGVIINAAGEAGASKSTALYSAASLWGQPELYTINGTNNGATVRGRNERVTVLANLPICVDEITHMPVKDAVDLAMGITQAGHRIRLQTDGVERAAPGSEKSTIMLTTANKSLHSVLSLDNAAGTAGSMRVFEMVFRKTYVHQKFEADDYLFDLRHNYGHLGEAVMSWVVKNREAVEKRIRAKQREIDTDNSITAAERFWSAPVAGALVMGEIARAMGLLSFDTSMIQRWVAKSQIPQMRGTVKEEYSDPLASLSDYLEAHNGNVIVVRKVQGPIGGVNIIRKPVGALLAHYDLDDEVLYVLKKGFKDYCARTGGNATQIIDELSEVIDGDRVIPQRQTRRVLGAGTEFAKVQSWCFAVNMKHPAVSGVHLKVVQGGGQSSAQNPPGLQVVK
jgi:hypothetical protein